MARAMATTLACVCLLVLAFAIGLVVPPLAGALGPKQPISQPPATAARSEGPRRPGGPVYPKQDIRVRMDHSLHLAKGINCKQCHQRIDQSKLSSQNDLPTGEACDACHGDQHPRVAAGEQPRCAECHTHVEEQRVTATTIFPRPHLSFSHQAHLARGADCGSCHGDMTKVGRATIAQLPKEATCLTCHDGKQASDTCSTCHPTGVDGRLLTVIGDDATMPKLLPKGATSRGAEHDLAFVEDHRGIAKANPELCASCHDDNFCADCHAGPIRPMRLHAGDYLTTHALDARANTQDCSSCHRLQTECRGCHLRMGVTAEGDESAFGVGSPLRFHPGDWSGPPGAPQGHALPAQRNISTCASCHTEDACLACHATTGAANPGLDASPHGPGFASSARCTALESRNRRVCLKCHAPGDIALECL
ncbi:Cytochrome c family protein [Enhygromyxa salina]|uniref:Cytochrome c family protein n=2 Tax=Enhygromyxa salina TaxID=215803 RepID=A0A0C2CUH9_9BACT|nr:Cytochrome c family protein [Enhygromyxa salina]